MADVIDALRGTQRGACRPDQPPEHGSLGDRSEQTKEQPMRAAVLRDHKIVARETADPIPGQGQLLVRTLACGICASDLHFMDHPDADADDDTGLTRYDANADIVMGH